MRAFRGRNYLAVCLIGLVSTASVTAQNDRTGSTQEKAQASSAFFRGYYLQNEQNDPAAAIEAYKKSLKLGASDELRQKIDSQIVSLQEDLAVADFAQLMPSNSIAYFEVSRVGHHFEKLAHALGIAGQHGSKSERVVLRIDDEIQIPSDFQISPALLREFKKARGAAVAITGIQEHGPSGVAIIHPGESDLMTGMVETGVQFVRSQDTIGGFPTYQIEDKAWFVKTNRLAIVATQRDLIENCIERINNSELDSIADNSDFQSAREQHQDYAVFAYLNPSHAIRELKHMRSRELAMARMLLDLDNMQHLAASLKASDLGLHFKSNLSLNEEHNSLAYGMLRTVPLSQKALGNVPSGSAAVVGMGLNPKMVLAADAASNQRITGLDLGRELFANIEELALFVLPSLAEQSSKVPDFGIIIASNDADKSEALWNQLLEIPAMIDMDSGSVSDVEIVGVTAKAYRIPEKGAPEILISRLNKDSMVAGTSAAVRAAIEASQSGENLANDAKAKSFNDAMTSDTAKAVYAHVGRCVLLASQMERGPEAQKLAMISNVVENMNVAILCDEADSSLKVRTDLTGLPKFENIIKSVAKMQSGRGRVVERSNRERRVADRPRDADVQNSASDRATDF